MTISTPLYAAQVPELKNVSYDLRTFLNKHITDKPIAKVEILNLVSRCLGYESFQDLHIAAKGRAIHVGGRTDWNFWGPDVRSEDTVNFCKYLSKETGVSYPVVSSAVPFVEAAQENRLFYFGRISIGKANFALVLGRHGVYLARAYGDNKFEEGALGKIHFIPDEDGWKAKIYGSKNHDAFDLSDLNDRQVEELAAYVGMPKAGSGFEPCTLTEFSASPAANEVVSWTTKKPSLAATVFRPKNRLFLDWESLPGIGHLYNREAEAEFSLHPNRFLTAIEDLLEVAAIRTENTGSIAGGNPGDLALLQGVLLESELKTLLDNNPGYLPTDTSSEDRARDLDFLASDSDSFYEAGMPLGVIEKNEFGMLAEDIAQNRAIGEIPYFETNYIQFRGNKSLMLKDEVHWIDGAYVRHEEDRGMSFLWITFTTNRDPRNEDDASDPRSVISHPFLSLMFTFDKSDWSIADAIYNIERDSFEKSMALAYDDWQPMARMLMNVVVNYLMKHGPAAPELA